MPYHSVRSKGRLLSRDMAASLVLGIALAASSSAIRAQSAAPADTTKLILGEGSTGITGVPIYVAELEGFFKKAGLDVEGQKLNGGTSAAMAAFANGSINILNLSVPELIQYTANKVIAGKTFAQASDLSYDIVVAKGITSIPDIKGKTVGVSAINSGDYVYLVATMQKYGLTPKDVVFVTSGGVPNRIAALATGAIQVTTGTSSLRDEEAKAGTILIEAADSPVQYPINTFIASNDFIKAHSPLLKQFVKVLQDTVVWMRSNPDAAAADCAKALGATVDVCKAAIKLTLDKTVTSKFTWSSTFAVDVEGVKTALAVMATIDPATKGVTVDDIVDTSIAGTTP